MARWSPPGEGLALRMILLETLPLSSVSVKKEYKILRSRGGGFARNSALN